jgi:predicted dehydrogenase
LSTARIAIIGAGWWAAENHIPNLKARNDVDIVAICAKGPENLKKVQASFDIPSATESYQELLNQFKPDGVIVSSPHVCHYEHAKAAIAAGAHVLVEKPFTTSSAQARELVHLSEESSVSIIIPFGYNFSDLALKAAEYIRGDLLGEIRHVALHMASATQELFLGKPLSDTKHCLLQPSPSTWADPSRAGGFGWGQLSHALGLMFLMVDDNPKSVFAQVGLGESGVDLFDAAIVRFRSGATAAISGSSALASHAKSQLDLRLYGTKGDLSLDFEREILEIHTSDGRTFRPDFDKGVGTYSCRRPVDLLVDVCLGRGGLNPASGIVGSRATEVLDAMYRSVESGYLESV